MPWRGIVNDVEELYYHTDTLPPHPMPQDIKHILDMTLKHATFIDSPGSMHLKDIHPEPPHGFSHDDMEEMLAVLHAEMFDLQARLHAEGKKGLLIVLQAMDAAGKDGTVKSVFSGLNPQACQVTAFKEPSKEELAHDFLWRIHAHVPPRGSIGIFNRSHYEDVTAARVEGFAPKKVWEQRFDHINAFEELLHDEGTITRKFYLHISKDEQKKRFEARLEIPKKHWKFSRNDVLKRQRWGDYMDAFEEVFERCSTSHAPWIIVPANDKRFRDLIIASVLVQTLREIDPKYPEVQEDLKGIKIPD